MLLKAFLLSRQESHFLLMLIFLILFIQRSIALFWNRQLGLLRLPLPLRLYINSLSFITYYVVLALRIDANQAVFIICGSGSGNKVNAAVASISSEQQIRTIASGSPVAAPVETGRGIVKRAHISPFSKETSTDITLIIITTGWRYAGCR